jgi:hypothetical protein
LVVNVDLPYCKQQHYFSNFILGEKMKAFFIIAIFVLLSVGAFAQNKIPTSIKTDTTLKPLAKPYESSGFIVEKGATLTIQPGTIITIKTVVGTDAVIRVNGGLIVGAKGPGPSKPVIINGDSPAIVFKNAKIEINGLELAAPQVLFEENSTGTIQNCKFLSGPVGVYYKMAISVPKTGNLTFNECLMEDKSLEINTTDFPNDLDKLILNKCSFTTKWSAIEKKMKLHLLASTAFAYGSKCDCYYNIEFRAFDWVLKKKLENEWYIGDESQRKTLEGSVKSSKTFFLKLPSKPFTTFKQDEPPKEGDKEKKK